MGRTTVFVGPTLPPEQVRALLPGCEVRPPVRHGDLLALDAAAGDRVLLIDGLFLQAAPVRHREILYLLENGVTVAGSSSMGALRAAELWQFGMRGVGEVFRLYRDGVVTGDDEVAIVHGEADTGHGALSEPLVNIRVALRESAAVGVVTAEEAAALLEMARAIPFRSRSYRALGLAARTWRAPDGSAVPMPAVERFLAWTGENAVDVKAADARLLLGMAAGDHPSLRPHGPDDAPIVNVGTHPLRFWRAQFAGREVGGRLVTRTEEVAAVMVTHRDFPAEHRRQVLADLVAGSPDDPGVPAAALDLARRRGLSADTDEAGWLVAGEAALPDDERLCRLLVRAFGTSEYGGAPPARLPAALDVEPVLADARAVAGEAAALNERLPRVTGGGPPRRLRFRDEVIDRVFAGRWGCDAADLRGAVWDRGFAGLESFRVVAEPFVAYLKYGPG